MKKKRISLLIGILLLFSFTFVSASSFGYGGSGSGASITTNVWSGNLTSLSELADTNIIGPNNLQLLQYQTTDNKWHPYSFVLGDWWDYDYNDLINNPSVPVIWDNAFNTTGDSRWLTSFTEVDPKWTDNFTKYNSTWSANTGISWSDVINGTLLLSEDWNATNESYYLKSNPFSYYNSTNLQTETDPKWSDNFTKYNTTWSIDTGISWANAINGTLYLSSNPSNYINWGNAMNGTLAELSDVLSWDYYNSTDFSISDYYLKDNPFSFYNSTTLPASEETNWNANYSDFLVVKAFNDTGLIKDWNSTGLIIDWNFSSYIIDWNSTGYIKNWDGDIVASNTSLYNWIVAQSYLSWSDAVNGTLLTEEVDPKWTDNFTKYNTTWSTDTGILWSDAVNGTLYLSSNPSNYISWSDAVNGTLLTEEVDPKWTGNQSSYSTTAEVLAFGYYNSTDFVITDYFTKSDITGFGYYNSTDFSIDDYFTSAEVLAFDYYNSTDFSIDDYFTSAQLLGFNYYNSTDFSISDYYTKTQIDNFDYYNASDFNIADYYTSSQTDTAIQDANTTVVNWVDNLFVKFTELVGQIGNWSANKTNYYTKSEVTTNISSANTSMKGYADKTFYLQSNPFNFYNLTTAPTYLNDTFAGNYSTYLTLFNWNKTYADTLYYGINNPYEFYNSTDFSISDYYLKSNPFGFYNLTNPQTETDSLSLHLNQDNWNNDSNDWIYWDNPTITFNESKLSAKYYDGTSSTAIKGIIDGGTLADTQHSDAQYDSVTLNFSEEGGSPGLDLRVNFTGVEDFSRGIMRYKTGSLSGDYPVRQLWNYNTNNWDTLASLSESEDFVVVTMPVFNNVNYIQDGIVQLRLYKSSSGKINNHYYIDWIAMVGGYGIPSGQEIDPLSFHRDANINNSGYNITADYFFGNGSQLTGIDTTETLWNANYSDFLALPTLAEILGWSYYNSTNFSISDYYLKSNPFNFWNNTYATFNKTYADTLYTNIGSYGLGTYGYIPMWNDTASLNNSVIFQDGNNISIGGADATQKFVVDSGNIDIGAFFGLRLDNNNRFIKLGNPSSDVSIISVDDNDALAFGQENSFSDNGSTFVELMRITRKGGTNSPLIGINTTTPKNTLNIVGELNVTGVIYGNGSRLTDLNVSEIDLGGYIPYTSSNANVVLGAYNFSVDTNVLFIDSSTNRVGIGTISPSVKLEVNGTINASQMLVNGSEVLTSFTEVDPKWTDNFTKYNSTWSIDTGISWANAVNGTLFTQDLWNTNYTSNNALWLLDTDTFVANYSNFLTHIDWSDAVNGTLYLSSNPSGYIDWSDAVNGTLLTEETFTQTEWDTNYTANNANWLLDTDTFVGNYSTFLTHIDWSDAVNGTLYLSSNPFGFYNSTDFSISDYLLLSGGTMIGAINGLSNSFISNGEGLVSYWAFDEETGSIAYDSAGSNDGTIISATLNSSGKFGNCYDFDGVNDYIDINGIGNLTSGAISLWAKTNRNSIASDKIFSANSNTVYLQINTGGTSVYSVFLDSGETLGVIGIGVWNCFTFSWDGTDISRYFNGNLISTEAYAGTPDFSDLTLGTRFDLASWFNGSIDEVKIFNRALTQEEITAEYLLSPHASGTPDGDKLRKTGDTATGNYSFDSGTLFIDSTGRNVGIGTTSPGMKLIVETGQANERIGIGNTTSNNPGITISDTSGNNDRVLIRDSINNVYVGDLDDNNGDLYLRAGGVSEMTILNGGKVGIGTTTPQNLLDLRGTKPQIRFTDHSVEAEKGYLGYASSPNMLTLKMDIGGSNTSLIFSHADPKIRFNTPTTESALTIYNNGNVNIDSGNLNVSGNYINGVNTGQTGNYSIGYCWFAYSGGIMYSTNCTAY